MPMIFQEFGSEDRVTVMVMGDPHVISLDYHNTIQTCDSLEYFMEETEEEEPKETVVAAEPMVLLSNEYFKITGILSRWSANVTGTYLSSVCDIFFAASHNAYNAS